MMISLFNVKISNFPKHLKNIFESNGLEKIAIRKYSFIKCDY